MIGAIKAAGRLPPVEYDEVLAWLVLALLAFGLVMVYSASIATAEASKFTGHHPTYYLVRQAIFIAAGFVAGVMAFQIPSAACSAVTASTGFSGALGRPNTPVFTWPGLIVMTFTPCRVSRLRSASR